MNPDRIKLLEIPTTTYGPANPFGHIATSEGLVRLVILKRRFPEYNLVRCDNAPIRVVVISGSGNLMWWNDPRNNHERIPLSPGSVVDIGLKEAFAFEPGTGGLDLLLIASKDDPLDFTKITID